MHANGLNWSVTRLAASNQGGLFQSIKSSYATVKFTYEIGLGAHFCTTNLDFLRTYLQQ